MVVVAGALVVVVAPAAVVVVALGAVVVVVTGAAPPASRCRPKMIDAGGLGMFVPSGTNPDVISWRFANLKSAGSSVVAPPVSTSSWFLEVVVEITQERACTTPTLPASGVPAPHFWPLV